LVRRLLSDGRRVRVLLRQGSNNLAMDGLKVERVYGDLRDREAVDAAVCGCETIFHCAAMVSTLQGSAKHKRDIYESNVLGTQHLLAAAKLHRVRRVVCTGSFSATGYDLEDSSRASRERQPFFPFKTHLPYARTKVLTEHECLRSFADGLDVVMVTSTAILGPNDYKPSRMGRTLIDHANGKLRAYIPGGFEFVAARDIVEGHMLAMERGVAGQKYTIASRFLTLDDIMDIFEDVTGVPRPRLKLPPRLMQAVANVSSAVLTNLFPSVPQRFTPDAVRILQLQRRADTAKARTELGFVPTDIGEAIREAYDDFARRGLLPPRMSIVDRAPESAKRPAADDKTVAAA
jgi:nucleoside-diphosphate-sugar epimerase